VWQAISVAARLGIADLLRDGSRSSDELAAATETHPIKRELAPPNEGSDGTFSDLNMRVALGGRERTHADREVLFATAGFRLTGVIPTVSSWSVVEGVPA